MFLWSPAHSNVFGRSDRVYGYLFEDREFKLDEIPESNDFPLKVVCEGLANHLRGDFLKMNHVDRLNLVKAAGAILALTPSISVRGSCFFYSQL